MPRQQRRSEKEQQTIFDPVGYEVEAQEWIGMPEFNHKNMAPCKQLIVNFERTEDIQEFARLLCQKVTETTRSIWFPEVSIERYSDKRYNDESAISGIRDQQGAVGVEANQQGPGTDGCALPDSGGASGV